MRRVASSPDRSCYMPESCGARSTPTHTPQDDGNVLVAPVTWVPPLEAGIAGAMLLTAGRHVWPLAVAHKAKRARMGLLLALCIGTGASVLQALLCASTPYCLR